jgi:hypothetical protein
LEFETEHVHVKGMTNLENLNRIEWKGIYVMMDGLDLVRSYIYSRLEKSVVVLVGEVEEKRRKFFEICEGRMRFGWGKFKSEYHIEENYCLRRAGREGGMDLLQQPGGIDSLEAKRAHHHRYFMPSVGESTQSKTLHTERNRGKRFGG